ncbi:MAG: MFS transporter [Promethearchaeota archaeon]
MEEEIKYNYGTWTHISYGLGGFLDNFLLTAFTVWVIAFYEDILLLPVVLVGFAFVIYGFWNSLNDPLIGYISDKTIKYTKFTSKWGRRFPWFLIAALPCAVCYFFIFTPIVADTALLFIYLIIIICLYEFFYSLWNVSWLALFPDKFRSNEERTKVAGIFSLFGNLGIALGMLIPPIFIQYKVRSSYVFTALLLTIISIVNIILMAPGMREDEKLRERAVKQLDHEKYKEPFIFKVKFALKQKNFLAYLFVYLGQLILMILMLSSLYYFTRYVLQMSEFVQIIISAAFLVGSIIPIPLWVWVSRKYGNRKVYLIGTLSTALVCLTMLLILFIPQEILLTGTIILTFFLGFCTAAVFTNMYPMFSDVLDEMVIQTGIREEGTYYGIRTFFGRLAIVIQAVVFAIIHTLTGYKANADIQTPLAIFGIMIIMTFIPMIFYFLGFLFTWKVNDLTLEKVAQNKAKLKELGL